ncbi:unnamed protein product [Nippostrongylus brasiliensis]|uniref:Uncharacterized protein n=1 Tax=Nippostrongylus brasiliensis TaxID=27835 RepID=A0A0N4XJ58_NIPBR|nr:unnamed protein product [Nippostrongylus brasiliensis]
MNNILCGSIFCSRKKNLISAFFTRLQMELRSLGENPIVIEYEGKAWRVRKMTCLGFLDGPQTTSVQDELGLKINVSGLLKTAQILFSERLNRIRSMGI